MPSGLDSFLEFIMPLAIFVFFIYLMREPLSGLVEWIKSFMPESVEETGDITDIWEHNIEYV